MIIFRDQRGHHDKCFEHCDRASYAEESLLFPGTRVAYNRFLSKYHEQMEFGNGFFSALGDAWDYGIRNNRGFLPSLRSTVGQGVNNNG